MFYFKLRSDSLILLSSLLSLILFFASAPLMAGTSIFIDPKNRFASITITSSRLATDSGPSALFQGLNAQEEDLGGQGARRFFTSPLGDLELSCNSVPSAGFAICNALIKAGPNAEFDFYEKSVKYSLEGPQADVMLKFFHLGAHQSFSVAADDKRFGLSIASGHFLIKGHPFTLPEEP